MITFLAAVILAIGVVSIYFVFVNPPENSDPNEIDGNDHSIELFKYFEDNFWRLKNMEPLCVFYFLQVSTEPINKDLGDTETSNQETISSKNTEDFSGQISTYSGIEITTFRSLKDTSTIYFLQANTTFSNSRPTSTFLPTNTVWTTKSIRSNIEDLSPTISSIDLQGDLVFRNGGKNF